MGLFVRSVHRTHPSSATDQTGHASDTGRPEVVSGAHRSGVQTCGPGPLDHGEGAELPVSRLTIGRGHGYPEPEHRDNYRSYQRRVYGCSPSLRRPTKQSPPRWGFFQTRVSHRRGSLVIRRRTAQDPALGILLDSAHRSQGTQCAQGLAARKSGALRHFVRGPGSA